jgi:NAD-dependent SIR2 family protein deacetylase
MAPFRCYNPECTPNPNRQFDFWATEPVCPKCKADQRKSDDAGIIMNLEVIHFDPPHPKYAHMGRGTGANACSGKPKGMRTGDPRHVNCPKCLETAELKKAVVDWECMADMPPESAFEAFRRAAPEKAKEYETSIVAGGGN